MSIERPHHLDPREHGRPIMLGNQQQRFHRGLPFVGVVFALGQAGDVACRVAEGDQLFAVRQYDRIEKSLIPRQRST
jgi:hypothetical protein